MGGSARRLRERLAAGGLIRSVAVHDVFSALLAERAGLELLFCGGFGTSASLLGLPDLNFLTVTEMADAVRRTAARVGLPVIADGDTGHGDLPQVARTVELFEQAGAAGVILEDQVAPKRCGHFADKQVISAEEMRAKLRAALAARQDPDFVIIARTDARASEGFAEAVRRANLYGDTGADLVFVEAPEGLDELAQLTRLIDHRQMLNLLTGGRTPLISFDEAALLGFAIAVWPIETLLAAGRAVERLFAELMAQGRADHLCGEGMMSFAEVKDVLGLSAYLSLAEHLREEV